MKKWNFTKKLLLFFLLFSSFTAEATHIVGGVMNYRYLGNNNFEISLFVYRDNLRGSPGAPLDDPAIIRVFDGSTETQQDFTLPFDSFLPLGQIDPCATIDIVEDIDWTNYKGIINLPPNPNGYTVYYQRCCRNNSIVNITRDPFSNVIEWGATYSINIPPSVNGQHVNNSSPVFVNYPPVYICVNKPITYNHAARDVNGDRIVYSLCDPLSGGDVVDPFNFDNDEQPPFTNVQWRPPYNLSNLLGGTPLTIDPNTGVLSGTPNTIGQFVVGVCAEEYRNGILLTRTLRDFQFNVVDCGLQVISSFFAPTILCNDFTVNFQNQSTGATTYKWYFGDGDSSTLQNPSHAYADTGRYLVTLVCNQGQSCNSTFSQVISVQYKRIDADFTVQNTFCLKQGDTIRFTDRSTDSLNVVSWNWNFSNNQTSTSQHPIIIYDGTAASISATLLVTSVNGCTSTITKTINLFPKPPYTLTRSINKCSLETSQLNVSMAGNNTFSWTPTTGLSNPNIANPTTTAPVNTTYYVTIKSVNTNGDTCVQRDSVKVNILNTLQINANDTIKVCKDSVRLSVPATTGQTVIWSTSNTFVPIIGSTASISILQTVTIQKYYVKVALNGCEAIDSVVAIYNDTIPNIDLVNNILQCSNQVNLSAIIDNSESIIWSASPTFIPVVSNTNNYSTVQNIKTVTYYVQANFRSCSNKDSVKVTIQDTLPIISLVDTLNICRDVVRLNASVRNFTSVIWSTSPSFSPVIGNNASIVLSQSATTQVYYIKAFYRDCEKTDSIVVNYNDTIPEIRLNDSAFFCGNSVNANAIITNATSFGWSVNPGFTPIFSPQNSFTAIQTDSIKMYYLKADYRFCSNTDSIKIRIQSRLPQIAITDSFFVCADSVRLVGRITNYDSVIWSFDPAFTDVFATTPNITVSQTEAEKMYYVKVYYLECDVTDSFRVLYNDTTPRISLSSPGRFCSDSVFAYAFADFYTSVEWYDSPDLSHLIGTNLTLQITQPQGKHRYYFKANYKFCSSVDSIDLENVSIKYVKQNVEVCDGKTTQLDLNIQTPVQYDIIWYADNDTFETNNTDTLSITPKTTQTVLFSINNIYGCKVYDSLIITLNPSPAIDATVDKPIIFRGEQVQLNATQGQGYNYIWTPMNVVSGTTIYNPTSSPLQNTVYTVVVTNANLCVNEDTVSVQVLDYECNNTQIFIPNAFTPNNDGINDDFKVRSSILTNIHLEVYNRWGNKVFESNDINSGWNGVYKGQSASADVYGYYFTGECLQGEKITLKGNVTLLK